MSSNKAITIFIIEDDDVDAQGMTRSLKKRKIANPIVRAMDGLEALEMLRDHKIEAPYIILLDLQMPRMNGLEFLQEIRDDDDLNTSVIFVLTTSKAEQDIAAAYEKQVAGYFVKDEVGENFMDILDMLEGYWRIAYLPN